MATDTLTMPAAAGQRPLSGFSRTEDALHDVLEALEDAIVAHEDLTGADPADASHPSRAAAAWAEVRALSDRFQRMEPDGPAETLLHTAGAMIASALEDGEPAWIRAVLDGSRAARALFPLAGRGPVERRATVLLDQAEALVRRMAALKPLALAEPAAV